MANETISLEFLAKQATLNNDEMRQVRKDLADVMRLVSATYELTRRVERRQTELRDDVELTIRMELGGALTHVQTSVDASLARIEDTVAHLSQRVTNLESNV